MACKFLYLTQCNLNNAPCFFTMSATEVCCEDYVEDNYRDNPEHEREGRDEEFA